jgi:hypothetical protein
MTHLIYLGGNMFVNGCDAFKSQFIILGFVFSIQFGNMKRENELN